ncbi:hypothetical protein N7454_000011 [Penicillium verhagenii]|nr:hypothetical protein N7454_000011 [Penicillium verhagenii]
MSLSEYHGGFLSEQLYFVDIATTTGNGNNGHQVCLKDKDSVVRLSRLSFAGPPRSFADVDAHRLGESMLLPFYFARFTGGNIANKEL